MSYKLPIAIHNLGKANYSQVLAKQEVVITKLVAKAKFVTQLHLEASKRAVAENLSQKPEIPPMHDEENPIHIFIVEHDPGVFTMGKRDTTDGFKTDDQEKGKFVQNLVQLKRGGGLTYHGPGQLTMYPILHIPTLHKIAPAETKSPKQGALHWYTCLLEKTMMMTLRDFGIAPTFAGNTGVWVPENFQELHEENRKIQLTMNQQEDSKKKSKWDEASALSCTFAVPANRTSAPSNASKIGFIGLDFRQNCVMHGIALNIGMESLEPFTKIVICEMENARTTCMEECLLKIDKNQKIIKLPSVEQVGERMIENFIDLTGLRK